MRNTILHTRGTQCIAHVATAAMVATVALVPDLTAQTTAVRETPPAPAAPKDLRLPQATTITLKNGMKVTLVPYGRVPKVSMQLSIRTGRIDEGPDDVSISSVVANMLLEGTSTRSAQDISRLAAEMGGDINTGTGNQTSSVSGSVLGEFAPQYVALLADVARNPKMNDDDLKRVLDRRARNNAMALAQPGTQSQQKFLSVMYGDHPFARIFPDEKMLRSFSVERVKSFHHENYGAGRAHLYVTGVFDGKAVQKAVHEAFDTWETGLAPTENPPTLTTAKKIELIDRPGAVQSSMIMGIPVADPHSPDWTALQVANDLLGGAFASRITSNIRENKGYTYSPYSTITSFTGGAIWMEIADVTTNVTGPAISEIFSEMNRLRIEPAPVPELDGIKKGMAGQFIITNSMRTGIISQLQFADLYELGPDYITGYVKRVTAINPDDVQQVANKYLDPSRVSIVVTGDRKVVEPQLEKLKPDN